MFVRVKHIVFSILVYTIPILCIAQTNLVVNGEFNKNLLPTAKCTIYVFNNYLSVNCTSDSSICFFSNNYSSGFALSQIEDTSCSHVLGYNFIYIRSETNLTYLSGSLRLYFNLSPLNYYLLTYYFRTVIGNWVTLNFGVGDIDSLQGVIVSNRTLTDTGYDEVIFKPPITGKRLSFSSNASSIGSGPAFEIAHVSMVCTDCDSAIQCLSYKNGDSVQLSLLYNLSSYSWNRTTDTTKSIYAKDTGLYIVHGFYNGNLVSTQKYYLTKEINIDTTFLCPNLPVLLQTANQSQFSYKWNTGDTLPFIYINDSGKYWVNCIVNNNTCKTDTFNTHFSSQIKKIALPKDTTYCPNSSNRILNVFDVSYTKYKWTFPVMQSGINDSSSFINITDTGNYNITVSNLSCSTTDTVHVSFYTLPLLPLVTDTFICNGTNLILDAKDSTYNTYQWNTGTTTSKINITQPGIYSVTASNGICTTSDTVNVKVNSLPQLHLTQDTVVCFDDIGKVVLDAGKFKSYYWYPTGQTTETIYATVAEQYVVVVTDTNNCVNKDTTLVEEKCGSTLYVPNIFTPNGDGINDVFLVHSRSLDQFEMRIYNRWGEYIFSSTDIKTGWDGTFSNSICPEGVYTWTIKYEVKGTSNSQTAYGSVTLLR